MTINILLLTLMTIAAMWTVMARSLIRSAIGLAATSALITIIMFRLASPLAAVFELSVCTGLITVVFVSTISLTRPMTTKEINTASKKRGKRYWYLPIILLAAGAGLMFWAKPGDIKLSTSTALSEDVRNILWNLRQLDLFGQIIIIIAGAIAVVVLFTKEKYER